MADMTPTNTDPTNAFTYAYDLETNIVQQTRIRLELDELLDTAWDDTAHMSEWAEAEQKEAELLAGFVSIR